MSLERNQCNLQKYHSLSKFGFKGCFITSFGDSVDNGKKKTNYIGVERKVYLLKQSNSFFKIVNYFIFSLYIIYYTLWLRPKVIILHDSVHLPVVSLLKIFIKIKIAVDFHEIIWDCGYSKPVSSIYRMIEKFYSKEINLAIFPNMDRASIIMSHSKINCPYLIFPNFPINRVPADSVNIQKLNNGKIIYFGSVNKTNLDSILEIFRILILCGFEIDVYPIGESAKLLKKISDDPKIQFYPPFHVDFLENVVSSYMASVCAYNTTCLNNRYCAPRKIYDSLYCGVPVLTNDILTPSRDPFLNKYVINLLSKNSISASEMPIISKEEAIKIRTQFLDILSNASDTFASKFSDLLNN